MGVSLTSMRKGCPGHIQRKVRWFGWCSCSLYRGPPRPRGQRSNLVGARRLQAGWAAAWSEMVAGRAKTPVGWPGENGSRRGSLGCGGAKCTLRATRRPAGENPGSRRRWAGGPNPGRRNGVHAGWLPCPPYRRCASWSGLNADSSTGFSCPWSWLSDILHAKEKFKGKKIQTKKDDFP